MPKIIAFIVKLIARLNEVRLFFRPKTSSQSEDLNNQSELEIERLQQEHERYKMFLEQDSASMSQNFLGYEDLHNQYLPWILDKDLITAEQETLARLNDYFEAEHQSLLAQNKQTEETFYLSEKVPCSRSNYVIKPNQYFTILVETYRQKLLSIEENLVEASKIASKITSKIDSIVR